MNLGDKIKNLRKINGKTQYELAEYCDVTSQYISKLENNHRTNPSNDILIKIAEFLDVEPSYFINRNPDWYNAFLIN